MKMSPLTKYDTIAPNLEINEKRFGDIDHDVHADSRYKNGIDRSRDVHEFCFAPTQGLHCCYYSYLSFI